MSTKLKLTLWLGSLVMLAAWWPTAAAAAPPACKRVGGNMTECTLAASLEEPGHIVVQTFGTPFDGGLTGGGPFFEIGLAWTDTECRLGVSYTDNFENPASGDWVSVASAGLAGNVGRGERHFISAGAHGLEIEALVFALPLHDGGEPGGTEKCVAAGKAIYAARGDLLLMRRR